MLEEEAGFDQKLESAAFQEGVDLSQVKIDSLHMARALEHNFRLFANFYLGDKLTFDIPEVHIKAWELLTIEQIEYVALALPRGHAKTTLAKLVVVYHFLYRPHRFCVYLSETVGISSEACQDIINFLMLPNSVAVFGEPEFKIEQDGRGFYKFWLTLPHRLDRNGYPVHKFCILKAFGTGQQVRGLNIDNERPDLAVCDDVESDDNTATEALIKKLKLWFYGPFFKAMSQKNKKIIFLGNLINGNGLFVHILKSSLWYSMRFGCIRSDGQPLWKELWPIEAIRADFKEYQELGLVGRWFAEMMNIPMADTSPLIDSSEIYYRPVVLPSQPQMCFITVDPAISQKTWADKSAVVCHGYVNGCWQVVDYVTMRMEPDRLFAVIVEMSRKWRTRTVGIEMAAFQKALKFLFDILMHMQQYKFNIIEVPHNNKRKVDRLAVWTAAMRKKAYGINEGDFAITEQLISFDPSKEENDDDLIDACSMGITMTENYMSYIVDDYAQETATANHLLSDLALQEV